MTTWILRMPENDSYVNSGGSYVDPIAESWEKEFIELIATDSGYIVGIFELFECMHFYCTVHLNYKHLVIWNIYISLIH